MKLFIVEQLKQGRMPIQISEILGMQPSALSYHLSSLKRAGVISHDGYGVWTVLKDLPQKEVQKSTQVAPHQPRANLKFFKPDSVRGHAFVFRFELPKDLRNWNRREELLQKAGIQFKPLKIFGGGQQLIFKDRKVWLTDKSIIIYEQESFIADLASESQSRALDHFMGLLRGLERHLQANFQIHRSRFKVSRQHYALIKNALAKQYDQEGKKLEVYTGEGLWFLIDNSFNLHEAETVHPKTGVPDNKKVQDFFNGIKAYEGFTPQFIVQSIAQNAQNLDQYAIHLKAHVESVQALGSKVDRWVEVGEELLKAVKELKK